MWWAVAGVALAVLVTTYLTWTAARVDRLHARAAAAYAALDAHLVRRAAAALALAEAAQLSPLIYAARIALEARPEDREVAENDLTRQLRSVVLPGVAPAVEADSGELKALVAVSRRVALARQVHNDVVRDALAVRRRMWVRAFRLARKHPQPVYFDVDDPALDVVPAQPVARSAVGGETRSAPTVNS